MDHDNERDKWQSDEERTWRGHGQEDDDEDVMIRTGSDRNILDDRSSGDHSVEEDGVESWAVDVRRASNGLGSHR